MSSNAEAIGHAALVATSAARLLDGALGVAALSFLGAAPTRSCSTRACTTPGLIRGRSRSPHVLRELLGADAVAEQGGGRPHPGPYPFRALPQVEGTVRDALGALERVPRSS